MVPRSSNASAARLIPLLTTISFPRIFRAASAVLISSKTCTLCLISFSSLISNSQIWFRFRSLPHHFRLWFFFSSRRFRILASNNQSIWICAFDLSALNYWLTVGSLACELFSKWLHCRKNRCLRENLLKFPWWHFRVNISLGPNEDRQLISGLHTVNDIYCSSCQQILGWRYVSLIVFVLVASAYWLQVHVLLQGVYLDSDLSYITENTCHVGNVINTWNHAALGQLSFHTETVCFYFLVNFSNN